MKTPGERGPYGRWLQAARLERGLRTAEDARRALQAAGISIAKSTYAEYESGSKQPSKNHLPELERFFGPFPGDTTEPTPDLASAVLALTRELAAIRQERAETIARLESRLAKLAPLEPLVDGLVEQALAVERGPSVPGASAGSGR